MQCSVFRIKTPAGESYTLPISQIVAVHSLSAELVAQLEAAAETRAQTGTDAGETRPFGFAAFTSLSDDTHPDPEGRAPDPARVRHPGP